VREMDNTIRQEIVAAAIAEVEKTGMRSVMEEKAKEVIDFMERAGIDIPTAIVALDFALFVLCVWVLDQGYVEVKPADVN